MLKKATKIWRIGIKTYVEGESQYLRLINHHFTTLASHFFGIAICIFHKTEIHMDILKC